MSKALHISAHWRPHWGGGGARVGVRPPRKIKQNSLYGVLFVTFFSLWGPFATFSPDGFFSMWEGGGAFFGLAPLRKFLRAPMHLHAVSFTATHVLRVTLALLPPLHDYHP